MSRKRRLIEMLVWIVVLVATIAALKYFGVDL